MQTRSGKLIANSLYSLLAWAAPLALGILVTPFLLKRMGGEAYGVYVVILGFVAYSFTFNGGRSVAKFVAEYRAVGDTRKINAAITAAFWVNLGLGIFSAVVIAGSAAWVVPYVLQISPEFQEAATLALVVGGISVPVVLVGQIFQNILQGENSFGKFSLITNLNWLLLNAGNVILVLLGFTLDSLLIWTLVIAAVTTAVSYFVAKRRSPDLGLRFGTAMEMIRPVAVYGSSIFLFQLFGNILYVFERTWVMRKFGGEVASSYVVAMVLAVYFHSFVASILTAAFPVMNELLGDPERSADLYKKATKFVAAFTVLFVVSIALGGRIFLSVWIDPDFASNAYWLLVIHTLTFGSIALLVVNWQLNEVHHAARLNSISVFFWSLVGITLMVFSADVWGVEGIAASRFVGVAVTFPIIFFSEKRFLGRIFWGFWLSLFAKVGAAAAVLAVVEYALFTLMGTGLIGLLLGTAAGTAAFGLVLLFTGFVADDEKTIFLRLIGMNRAVAE